MVMFSLLARQRCAPFGSRPFPNAAPLLRFSVMLLMLGDSFAFWAGQRCRLPPSVRTAGQRGGRLGDERFRRWAISTVMAMQPRRVLLIVGGNDIARPPFNPRLLSQLYEEIVLGILAAGADHVHVFPVPPRTSCRRGDVTVSVYRRRRRLVNLFLRRLFAPRGAVPSTVFGAFRPEDDFLGRDGVHPSAAGWASIAEYVRALAA